MSKLEKFVFNHDEGSFEDAIGVTEETVRETIDKVQGIVTEVQSDDYGCQSKIVESLMDNCTKAEICLMAYLLMSGRLGTKRVARIQGGEMPEELKSFLKHISKGEIDFDDDSSSEDSSKNSDLKNTLRNLLNDGL